MSVPSLEPRLSSPRFYLAAVEHPGLGLRRVSSRTPDNKCSLPSQCDEVSLGDLSSDDNAVDSSSEQLSSDDSSSDSEMKGFEEVSKVLLHVTYQSVNQVITLLD